MRVLLDECVPAPLRHLLTGCDCRSVGQCNWKGLKNGALLRVAERDFDVFVTSDQSIRYQQNLSGFRIAVLELSTNDYRRIRLAAGQILQAIQRLKAGEVVKLEVP